jgi:ATP-dependent Lhr-like helicase
VIASYLLDVAGAWRWLSGAKSDLARVPERIREITVSDEARVAELPTPLHELPLLVRDEGRPLVWVRSVDELNAAVQDLVRETVVGLDVETTLNTRALCLIQIAGAQRTYLIDALEISELASLSRLLTASSITKVIHCADFEREVLGRYDLAIEPVVDTREVSRSGNGEAAGGHSLQAVCARELKAALDKTEQTGDWKRRPLSDHQIDYAALDAEILLRLYAAFKSPNAASS